MTNHRWRRRRTPDRLEVGDEVVTRSGIYGFVSGFDDGVVWVEVDDNVQIRVDRAAIGRKVGAVAVSPGTAGDRSGLPEAVERRPGDVADYVAGVSDNR